MTSPLNVGDKVCLNNEGLKVIFGIQWRRFVFMKRVVMQITEVDPISYTHPEETHIVRVDNSDVDECLVYDACFDKQQ